MSRTQDGHLPGTGTRVTGDPEELGGGQEEREESEGLGWFLRTEASERSPSPMDTCVSVSVRLNYTTVDKISNGAFNMQRVFEAASKGDRDRLDGLLDYLRVNKKRLTGPEFTDETNGKTALLKALLNLVDGKNDTIEVLLDIAEKTGDLENFVNASYKDLYYKGQTALHIAIERRGFDHVKLLVQKGADVHAKASGKFFQFHTKTGFYFGELPLSLAACTNQLDVVTFLMENPYRCADATDRDSQGNTVLHALVAIADNTEENTDFITTMYDQILIQHTKLKKREIKLETIENDKGLTPLKLAAKMGKIGLFRHMVQREFTEDETRPLSRKFTEWVYGPIHSSLYDMSSLDTNEDNSVLEIIIFGSEIPNRHEMLQIEPLHRLLEEKWDRFASKIFLMNFLVYLIYLGIFTTVSFYRKEGQPPFPVEDDPVDRLRCVGELISVLGAVYFFCKAIIDFRRKPPNLKALYLDGFCEILFFIQGALLLVCAVLYCFGRREYVGPLVLSLALAWINILYYSRGSKLMGMYSVMIQRMILGDMLRFLFVYVVFLFGFSAAVVALIEEYPPAHSDPNNTRALSRTFGAHSVQCKRPTYNNIRFTILELFKFTIGMGDLEFTDHVQYKEVFFILLISYIVLTYILLLNMLIALMGDTVEKISRESENIWKLQRALTILDLERTLPRGLRKKLSSGVVRTLCFRGGQECRRFFRVEEVNWKKWRSNLGIIKEEEPGNHNLIKPDRDETAEHRGTRWNINPLLWRIGNRRHQPVHTSIL